MKRTFALLTMLLLAPVASASAQTVDNTMLLLQRLAAQNGGTAEVFVGKLPPGLPKVPLPEGAIVGGVHQFSEVAARNNIYQIYYDAAPGQAATYDERLKANGWTNTFEMLTGRGFVPSAGPKLAVYCKANEPLISAQTGADPRDLRIIVNPLGNTFDAMCDKNSMEMTNNGIRPPVPELRAPAGISMTVGQAGIQVGPSGAYISGASSAQNLLDNFSAQMRAAGWQAGATSAGTALVSQAFRYVDAGKPAWQCVITVYAIDGKPGDYIAFIDATNLSTLRK